MTIQKPTRTIPFGRPWITKEERQAVIDVLDGPILTDGPQTRAFEDEFAAFVGGGASAAATSSCTAALHLAYFAFGFGPGDEVVVPAQTHTATAHAVELVGATPIFVDCEPATGNITPESVAAAITPRTKAISVVHFGGIPCDMPEIMAIAKRHDLKVVEDCALAVGTRLDGTHAGLFGDVGCFSFYPIKHITTGEGGMATFRDVELAQRVRKLRAFGVDRSHMERTIPGMYDVLTLGLNYRMSELQGAIGRKQIGRIDENLAVRASNFRALKSALDQLEGVRVLDATDIRASNSHYCLTAVLEGSAGDRRNDVVALLNEAGVGTSVYYPQPVPRMTYYREKYGYDATRFTYAAEISDRSIALPVGHHITSEDVDYIATRFADALKGLRS